MGLSTPLTDSVSSSLPCQITRGLWSINVLKVIFTSVALGKITWKFYFRNTVVQQGKDALALFTVPIPQAMGNSAGTSQICLGKIWKIECLWV